MATLPLLRYSDPIYTRYYTSVEEYGFNIFRDNRLLFILVAYFEFKCKFSGTIATTCNIAILLSRQISSQASQFHNSIAVLSVQLLNCKAIQTLGYCLSYCLPNWMTCLLTGLTRCLCLVMYYYSTADKLRRRFPSLHQSCNTVQCLHAMLSFLP